MPCIRSPDDDLLTVSCGNVDGEDELGDTITTLSLGCDAFFTIRLKTEHYENADALEWDGEVVQGAKDWEKNTELREALLQGQDVDKSHVGTPDKGPSKQPGGRSGLRARRTRPEIEVPLVHGSLVIMHGKAAQEYYEHKVRVDGKLRLAVTTRFVDPEAHERIEKDGDTRRPSGQVLYYTGKQSRSNWTKGEGKQDEEDVDGNEDENESSFRDSPATTGTPQPPPRGSRTTRRGRGRLPKANTRGPTPAPTGRTTRTRRRRSNEDSPTGLRDDSTDRSRSPRRDGRGRSGPRATGARANMWTQPEIDRLFELRGDDVGWVGFGAKHGYGRGDDACKKMFSKLNKEKGLTPLQAKYQKTKKYKRAPKAKADTYTAQEDGDREDPDMEERLRRADPNFNDRDGDVQEETLQEIMQQPDDYWLSVNPDLGPEDPNEDNWFDRDVVWGGDRDEDKDDSPDPEIPNTNPRFRRTGETRSLRSSIRARMAAGNSTSGKAKVMKSTPARSNTTRRTPTASKAANSTPVRTRLARAASASSKVEKATPAKPTVKTAATRFIPAKSKPTKSTPADSKVTKSKSVKRPTRSTRRK